MSTISFNQLYRIKPLTIAGFIIIGVFFGTCIGYTFQKTNSAGLVNNQKQIIEQLTNNLEQTTQILLQKQDIINLQNGTIQEQSSYMHQLADNLEQTTNDLAQRQEIVNLQNVVAQEQLRYITQQDEKNKNLLSRVKTIFIKIGVMDLDFHVILERSNELNMTQELIDLDLKA